MALTSGAQIGPYEILAPLGAGGMGEVYCARDARLDRTVAVKILSSVRSAGAAQLDRFKREARAIGRLSHPHICTVYDVGVEDGVPFLVMEFLEGETLADRLARGTMPLHESLTAAAEIADALDAAHQKGVIHRDLKPTNVMLTTTGVKLLDFGLAKLREPAYEDISDSTESALTDSGTLLGTLPYVSPEQLEGRDIDSRADIFAFGVLLYEMIAGRRPFTGDSRVALMTAIVTAEPPPLTTLQPGMSPALQRLIDRSLAKNPDDRWQTARDLAAELRWIAEAGRTSTTLPLRPTRSPRLLMTTGIVAALLTAGAFAVFTAWKPPTAFAGDYDQVTYRRGVVSSARFGTDSQSFIYSASWEGQPYRVFYGRQASPDVRDFELETGRILSVSKSGEMAVLMGPQNIVQGSGTLARVPIAGGTRKDLLEGIVEADWIHGSDTLAVIRNPGSGREWTVEFPAGTVVHTARAAWSLRVSPDGSHIAFFEGPAVFDSAPLAKVTVIDRSGRKTTLSENWSGLGLAWSPSGREVWFTATRGNVAGRSTAATATSPSGAPWLNAVSLSGEERVIHRAPDWLVLHDIAADGSVLASRNTVRIGMACQPHGETSERDLSWLYASFVTGMAPDGGSVIFFDSFGGRTAAGNPTVFRRSLDGAAAVSLGEGSAATMSPDRKTVLALLNDRLRLLPTGAGSIVDMPTGDLTQIAAGAWLPDSRHIVFTGRPGTGQPRAYVQDIHGGAPRALTPEGTILPVKAAVRDQDTILARAGSQWSLHSISGGASNPLPILTGRDMPIQWSEDKRDLYVAETSDAVSRPAFDVLRVEIATGRRTLWKTLAPPDRVGVEALPLRVAITPDAQSYCYSYMRRLGDLFVVKGLQ